MTSTPRTPATTTTTAPASTPALGAPATATAPLPQDELAAYLAAHRRRPPPWTR